MKNKSELSLIEKMILVILPIVASLICIGIGRYSISLGEILNSIRGNLFGGVELVDTVEMTLWNIRLPRILLALLVGAGLSASGCA